MNVLHIRSSAGFYGAESVIVTLLRGLTQCGVKPTLGVLRNYLNNDQSLLHRATAEGIDAVELPCNGKLDWRSIQAIRKAAKRERADVIHAHDYKSTVYGVIASRLVGIPIVATLHGWTGATDRLRWYKKVELAFLRWLERVVVVSRRDRNEVQLAGVGEDRALFIPNGVDTERFTPRIGVADRSRWGWNGGHFVFGVVGRLSPEKGQNVALQAFATIHAQYPQAKLLLVGDGPDEKKLREQVAQTGLSDSVVFAGFQTDIPEILKSLDCYVSPSHTEGMPMILLEAMATGLPIVATDVGEVAAMLAQDAGIVVEPTNAASLAKAMGRVLESGNLAQALGQNARRRAINDYSRRAQAERYFEVYASVARGGR